MGIAGAQPILRADCPRKVSSSLWCRGRWDIPSRFTTLEFSLVPPPKEKHSEQRHGYRNHVRSKGARTNPSCREKLEVQRIDRNGTAGPVQTNLAETDQSAEAPKNLTLGWHGRADAHDEYGYAEDGQSDRQH